MNIVILTGAGISAESGISTFRDSGGLWEEHSLEEVATPQGFAANPALVHRFYNERRSKVAAAKPNDAHLALARLEQRHPGDVTIVTQNVDDLHEKAGSQNVWHMHGALARAKCASCEHRWDAPAVMDPNDPCPSCGNPSTRPDVVWFGEMPYFMNAIEDKLRQAQAFVSIGTSGQVYPAAGFVQTANHFGALTLELNLEPSDGVSQFDQSECGPASVLVPKWVDSLLASR